MTEKEDDRQLQLQPPPPATDTEFLALQSMREFIEDAATLQEGHNKKIAKDMEALQSKWGHFFGQMTSPLYLDTLDLIIGAFRQAALDATIASIQTKSLANRFSPIRKLWDMPPAPEDVIPTPDEFWADLKRKDNERIANGSQPPGATLTEIEIKKKVNQEALKKLRDSEDAPQETYE